MSLFDEELRGERAPEHLQDFISRIGGKNPHGIPMYRVVRAESVHHKAHGEFYDWPEEATIQERGGLELNEDGKWGQISTKPLRVVTETRWVQTYPDKEGWLLERWYPAHMFGTREAWEKHSLLGPYPENGRYVDCSNPIPHLFTLQQVENVIQAIEYKIQNKRGSMENRILKRSQAILDAMEADKQKKKQAKLDQMKDASSPLWGSSLAAGRLRTKLAERIGLREHVGS